MFLVLWANGLQRLHLLPLSVLFGETSFSRLLWLVWYPFYIPNLLYAAHSLAYKLLVGPSRHWLKTPPQPSTIENDVWLLLGLVALMYLDHNVSSRLWWSYFVICKLWATCYLLSFGVVRICFVNNVGLLWPLRVSFHVGRSSTKLWWEWRQL